MCFLQFNHPLLSDKEIKMTFLRITEKKSKPVNFCEKDPILKSYFKEIIFFSFVDWFLRLDTFETNWKISVDISGLGSSFLLPKKSNKGHRKLMTYQELVMSWLGW